MPTSALRALRLPPSDGVALCNLALVYELQGQSGHALSLFEQAAKMDSVPSMRPSVLSDTSAARAVSLNVSVVDFAVTFTGP